jgi:hypothetical protein
LERGRALVEAAEVVEVQRGHHDEEHCDHCDAGHGDSRGLTPAALDAPMRSGKFPSRFIGKFPGPMGGRAWIVTNDRV